MSFTENTDFGNQLSSVFLSLGRQSQPPALTRRGKHHFIISSKYQLIQKLHRLNCEKLHTPFDCLNFVTNCDFIKCKVVFYYSWAVNNFNTTTFLIEWKNNKMLGSMNGHLDELFMDAFESERSIRSHILEFMMDVIVKNVNTSTFGLFDRFNVDEVMMVGFL